MSMRDAARGACVSRAFARSWRCLPNLDFSEESLGINRSTCKKDEKLGDLTSKIDWILKNHSGIGIKKLIVQVGSVYSRDSCHLAHLDSWLQCAVKPGIEELIVNLSSMNAKYNFPCELLSSGTGDSLRYIYLASCNFHPTVRIGCLKSLTRLQLCMVNITENELRLCNDAAFYARTELPSSMPNLERLIIHSDTEMVNTPMVPSKFYHLKYLSIALGGQTYDYLSLVSFFDASPFLETFILNALRERTERVTVFGDPSGLRMMPEHRHDKLKETLMEAHRALKAVQTYIKLKVPSKVELNVLEPCSRCHALDL
uniref:At1g61320/AtMIF1 LRR domain-containing protein n=1 Tax=Oryza glumipatula TaxID=40148 RepID=A0A0E0A324_9ORYZ